MRDQLLTRHFLQRFLDNDLISPEADRHETLSVVGAALISSGLFVTCLLGFGYLAMPFPSPGRIAMHALSDRCLYLSWSMMVMALVAVTAWDALVLDARDTSFWYASDLTSHHHSSQAEGRLPLGDRLYRRTDRCAQHPASLGDGRTAADWDTRGGWTDRDPCGDDIGSRRVRVPVLSLGLFAVQFVLLGVVLVGFRHAVRIPAERRANWTFRLACSGDERPYLRHATLEFEWIVDEYRIGPVKGACGIPARRGLSRRHRLRREVWRSIGADRVLKGRRRCRRAAVRTPRCHTLCPQCPLDEWAGRRSELLKPRGLLGQQSADQRDTVLSDVDRPM